MKSTAPDTPSATVPPAAPPAPLVPTRIAPEPRRAWQWVMLAALVGCGAVSWSMFYMDFAMPNPDFAGFREMARAIYRGQPPETWKRMPAYPLIIGAIAAVWPGAEPYLNGTMIANLVLSVASLVMLYLLAFRLIGRAALVVVIGLLVTPYFSLMASQPMLEPLLGFCVLLGLYLMARGSGWAYAVGSYAALSRYEGALLIPIKWGVDMSTSPRRWLRHTLYAVLAGLPLVLWTGFTVWASRGVDSGTSSYGDELSSIARYGWAKVPLMFTPWVPMGPFRPIDLVPILALALVGLFVSLRRFPRMSLAIVAFFVGYIGVHLVFPVYRSRYAYPVLWVVPFYAVTGGDFLARLVWPRLRGRALVAVSLSVLAGLLAVAWLYNGYSDFGMIRGIKPWQQRWQFLLLPFTAAAGLLAFGCCAVPERGVTRVALGLCLAAILIVPSLRGAEVRAWEQGHSRYSNVDYRLIADWLSAHLKPGERAVVPTGKIKFFQDRPELRDGIVNGSDLTIAPRGNVDAAGADPAEVSAAFVAELHERGVVYLMMTSSRSLPTDPSHPNYERDRFWYYSENSQFFEPFRGGGDVPGFERIATLDVPAETMAPVDPVYVYRVEGK